MELLNKYQSEIKSYLNRPNNIHKSTFNFFTSISDIYYRENFHSDILARILGFKEVLECFIADISIKINRRLKFYSTNIIIQREKERIDISIVDKTTNQAIIIENKINNAPDMVRQLPRYIESLTSKGFEVVAVIYLSLTGNKKPSRFKWSDNDNKLVENISIFQSCIYRSDLLSLDAIFSKALPKINSIDEFIYLRQYRELLNILGNNEINNNIMENFYNKIQNKNDLDELITLKSLINHLPNYRAIRIRDHYSTVNKYTPFNEVLIWKGTTAYFNHLIVGFSDFAIDIECYETYYDLNFFDRNANTHDSAIEFLGDFSNKLEKRESPNRIYKTFNYPAEETELYSFIDTLVSEVRNNLFQVK